MISSPPLLWQVEKVGEENEFFREKGWKTVDEESEIIDGKSLDDEKLDGNKQESLQKTQN
jgi:hypothetical protein